MEELLLKLEALNIGVKVVDGSLKLQIPTGLDAKDIIEEIKSNKTELITYITNLLERNQSLEAIPVASVKLNYPLSSAQKRLYLWQQINLGSVAYNMPYVISIERNSDKEKIKDVIKKLIARHESFRTSFVMEGEDPVQVINDDIDFKLNVFTIKKSEEQEFKKQFIQPFDLSETYLFRAAIIDIEEERSLLMMDMHHIISDGVSQTVLEQEFKALYMGEELPELKLQYKDFSEWQNSKEQKNKVKKQEKYWLKRYEEEIPVLHLPEDFMRPAIKNFEGASVSFTLSKEETKEIRVLAENSDLTLYMTLLSIFTILLSKLSGQDDIVVGTPTAGRSHPDLQNVVGMFVNMLAIRNKINRNDTINECFSKIKQNTLDAFANQDYQFEELVEKLSVERDLSSNPLLDVVFNLINHAESSSTANEEESYNHRKGTSKFDINLTAINFSDLILFNFDYSTCLYKPETIERFIKYYKEIVNQIVENPQKKISEIEIITVEEKQQLLFEFNDTNVEYPKEKTVSRLFEEQVAKTPENIALKLDKDTLTYNELNKRANGIANNLREINICSDDIVGIFLDRSFETVISMLGVLKSGGAYMPLDPDYPEDRLNFILKDSKAKTVITTKTLSGKIEFSGNVICIDDQSLNLLNTDNPININKPSDLCYIIYTSGTTGNPKGVMVEHKNLVRLFFNDKFQFDFCEKDVWTMFHSHCFDFSVWEMYGALLYGGKLIIVPKIAARDVVEYFNMLENEKVTVLNQTPSAFYNLIEVALSKSNKPLKDLKYVIFGGEALKPNKLKKWFDVYSDVKLINMFGITETTVHVTYKEIGKHEIENNISNIGTPIPTLTTYIMDKDLRLVPIGVAGELIIGGDGVSRGYIDRDDLTKDKFIKNPYNPEERLYRSGDLVKMFANGEMEYLGRIDAQVQIRGFRIELGEIENQLLKHSDVNECVVLSKEREAGTNYLSCYYVSEKEIDFLSLRDFLSKVLPEYMVPSYFVYLKEFPLTPNKKLDTKSLPEPELKIGNDYVPPRNKLEEDIVDAWSEVLKVEKVGIDSNYFSLGGDSITALRLITIINKKLNVNVSLSDLFVNQTIRQFSKCVSNSGSNLTDLKEFDKIKKNLENEKERILSSSDIKNKDNVEDIYPASDIQGGMIFHSLKKPGVYHDQMVHLVHYPVMNTELLDKALYSMMEKHSILRTSFYSFENKLYQVVHSNFKPAIEHYNISNKNSEDQNDFIKTILKKDKNSPFEINEPVWRFFTFDLGKNAYCICFICHHAIIDGWSDASFNTELNNIYLSLLQDSQFTPAPLKSSYKDFVIDQIYVSENKELTDFWKNDLDEYKRFSFDFKSKENLSKEKFDLVSGELHDKLKIVSSELNMSLKNIFFSAFMYTLKMFSYHNDVTIGLITNNRPVIEDGDKILGCFLNTVPIRVKFSDNQTWREYLKSVDEKLNKLKKYDKISFLKIVQLLDKVYTSQNPVTDIIFNYVDFHIYDELKENELSHIKKDNEEFKPLSNVGGVEANSLFAFNVNATRGNFSYILTYETSFISEECVNEFFDYFRAILNSISSNSDEMIQSKNIISKDTLDKILYEFNDTKSNYPKEKTIVDLFEEQVKKGQEESYIIDCEQKVSYKELNSEANKLAHYLRKLDIRSDNIVGIEMDSSYEFIVCMLGILKAGGAYLPIDENLPITRKEYIINNSKIKYLISNNTKSNNYNDIININYDKHDYKEFDGENLEIKRKISHLAYVIYTSGSTGKPKGTLLEHKGIVSENNFWKEDLQINKSDRCLQFANISFDASVAEIFMCLFNGASLYIPEKSIKEDKELFEEYLVKNKISVATFPPPFADTLDEDALRNFRLILTAGSETNARLINKFNKYTRYINAYGPTETSICATYWDTSEYDKVGKISIGRPIRNIEAYILDSYLNLQGIGVLGELCFSGDALARGYLENSTLTAEKFIEHPFKEGERLYRTGDLARWLPDGNIEFLGRIDNQVKIRGFRIELGEIENALLSYENINESLVLAREENGEKYLCAYLVCQEELNQEDLRNYLSLQLPKYMLPSFYVELDAFPLTNNGKVDRKSLPQNINKTGDDYVPPSNNIEEKLVKIWSEVLNIAPEEISIASDYFVIGGNSLNAVVLISKISKEFNVKIQLGNLFETPTISAIGMMIFNLSELEEIVEDIEI